MATKWNIYDYGRLQLPFKIPSSAECMCVCMYVCVYLMAKEHYCTAKKRQASLSFSVPLS